MLYNDYIFKSNSRNGAVVGLRPGSEAGGCWFKFQFGAKTRKVFWWQEVQGQEEKIEKNIYFLLKHMCVE